MSDFRRNLPKFVRLMSDFSWRRGRRQFITYVARGSRTGSVSRVRSQRRLIGPAIGHVIETIGSIDAMTEVEVVSCVLSGRSPL